MAASDRLETDSPRVLKDIKLLYLSLDLWPGPYQSIPASGDTPPPADVPHP